MTFLKSKILIDESEYIIKSQTLFTKIINDTTIGIFAYGDTSVCLFNIKNGKINRLLNFDYVNWDSIYRQFKIQVQDLYYADFSELKMFNKERGTYTPSLVGFFNDKNKLWLEGFLMLRLKGSVSYNYNGQLLEIPKTKTIGFLINVSNKNSEINIVIPDTVLSNNSIKLDDVFCFNNVIYSGNKFLIMEKFKELLD